MKLFVLVFCISVYFNGLNSLVISLLSLMYGTRNPLYVIQLSKKKDLKLYRREGTLVQKPSRDTNVQSVTKMFIDG